MGFDCRACKYITAMLEHFASFEDYKTALADSLHSAVRCLERSNS